MMSEEAGHPVGSKPSCCKRVVLVGRHDVFSCTDSSLLVALVWVRYQTYWGILVAWQHPVRFLMLEGPQAQNYGLKRPIHAIRSVENFQQHQIIVGIFI